MRQLKLMWDYHCWPLWLYEGLEADSLSVNTDPATLPLLPSTIARLSAWAAIPDAKLAEHIDAPQDMIWTDAETRSFEEEGRALWAELQREIGEEYYVVYFSMTAGRVLEPHEACVA
jgi:hypothetical protein